LDVLRSEAAARPPPVKQTLAPPGASQVWRKNLECDGKRYSARRRFLSRSTAAGRRTKDEVNLKRAVEPSTLFGFWFQGFKVSWFQGFIQIGIGIAIGIDCLTTEHTEHTERHGSVSVCLVCSVVPIRNGVLHQIGAARISTEADVYGALLKICMLNCSF
jgi:hypothetical protein